MGLIDAQSQAVLALLTEMALYRGHRRKQNLTPKRAGATRVAEDKAAPFAIERKGHFPSRPTHDAVGKIGSNTGHSPSITSIGKRKPCQAGVHE
jgi:hypothetical protein